MVEFLKHCAICKEVVNRLFTGDLLSLYVYHVFIVYWSDYIISRCQTASFYIWTEIKGAWQVTLTSRGPNQR